MFTFSTANPRTFDNKKKENLSKGVFQIFLFNLYRSNLKMQDTS